MKPAIFSTQARKDFIEALRWIANDNPKAAQSLKDAVQKAARNLGDHPLSGRERVDLASPPVRFLPLAGFPYVIVYDSALTPPIVLRFFHGARDLPELLKDI